MLSHFEAAQFIALSRARVQKPCFLPDLLCFDLRCSHDLWNDAHSRFRRKDICQRTSRWIQALRRFSRDITMLR